jgi:hypothetical protein
MKADQVIHKLEQEISQTEREFLVVRVEDAKKMIDKLNFLENVVAGLLKSIYDKRLLEHPTNIAV